MKKFFLLLSVLVFLPLASNAAVLSPTKIELTVDQNSSQVFNLKIRNNENAKIDFKPVVMGVEQNEQGAPQFVSGLSEVESWVSYPAAVFSLSPNEENKVTFKVDVPAGSYPGSYYLGVGFEQAGSSNGTIGLSARLLTIVNIKVSGTANEQLEIKEWASGKLFNFSPDWQFDLKVFNQGNVEVPLKGKIIVRNFFGKEIYRKDYFLGNKMIPGTSRDLKIDLVNPSKLPGMYSVDLVVNYGLTGQSVISSDKIFFCNLWAGGALAGLIVILVLFKIVRQKNEKDF